MTRQNHPIMRVKKIELIGFKSFADRTEIILGEGTTCIVGPNGCGKSNISDAIRWVFGERSAKLLRGSKMEDVIFSGTEFRKPLGMAEVSLTLDNSDHSLQIEYEEVVISRRLYRSGQSEYFLNRTQCRLKDILDLILDTGMGSNSYSMMEQGQVDAVINMDPDERRSLIEEAAGISKYKVKKEEALRKLERTEQNLLRIRDIVTEIQRNIQYAEKQARRAERYKNQFEELKKLETVKAFLDLSKIKEENRLEEAKKQQLFESIEKVQSEIGEFEGKTRAQRESLEEILKEEAKHNQQLFDVRSEHRSVIEKRQFNQERAREYQRRQIEIEKEREILGNNLSDLEKEAESKSRYKVEAMRESEEAKEALEREREIFEGIDTEFHKRREETEKFKAALFENASESTQFHNELNRLQTLLETGGYGNERRKGACGKFLNEKASFEKRRVSCQEELVGVANDLCDLENTKKDSLKELLSTKDEKLKFEKELADRKVKLQGIISRLKLLRELEETAEEAHQKLSNVLGENRLQGRLVRTLRDVLHIRSGYESAVEAVLGAFAQALIAEDVETAKEIIVKMSEAHMGPCGIFVKSLARSNGKHAVSPPEHPSIQYAIHELVKVQDGMGSIFESLFHNTYVVEDFIPEKLDELLPIAQEFKLVTKQGILLGPEARIFFRNGKLTAGESPFQRQAEITQLSRMAKKLEEEIVITEEKEGTCKKKIAISETNLNALEDKLRDFIVRKEANESLLRGIEERLENVAAELKVLQFEADESEKELQDAEIHSSKLARSLESLKKSEHDLTSELHKVEQAIENIRSKREEQIHIVARHKAFLEGFEEKLKALDAGEGLVRTQIERGKDRVLRLIEESSELKRRTEEISQEDKVLEESRGSLEKSQKQIEHALSEILGRKGFQEEGLKQLTSESSKVGEELKDSREKLHQIEMKLMELSYGERTVRERMEQTYNVKLSELKSEDFLSQEIDYSKLQEEMQTLKQRVDSFGPVNLLAVDEYEELKQRFEFLSTQEKDLNEARESLLEAIRRINRTTKTLFAETFARAQSSFQEYYQILFRGGHAELVLLEGEEGQEVGVDIVVRPPGKKLQHISLLSGGEKSLTALALLFALFRIKPSPLCVLDEVDAPLDEANVERFLNVLRTFASTTQFLIVTHNRKTIANGDYLYGVTMEEAGVSKLVSVKVNELGKVDSPKESEKPVAAQGA